MEKFGKSQPVIRKEDVRFLTGQGRYVDDIAPEGALYAFVFRLLQRPLLGGGHGLGERQRALKCITVKVVKEGPKNI